MFSDVISSNRTIIFFTLYNRRNHLLRYFAMNTVAIPNIPTLAQIRREFIRESNVVIRDVADIIAQYADSTEVDKLLYMLMGTPLSILNLHVELQHPFAPVMLRISWRHRDHRFMTPDQKAARLQELRRSNYSLEFVNTPFRRNVTFRKLVGAIKQGRINEVVAGNAYGWIVARPCVGQAVTRALRRRYARF